MGPSRVRIVGVSIVIALAGLLSCGRDHPPAKPSHLGDWFVLEIERDGSLSLDGQRISHRDTAEGFALLAEKARSNAHAHGKAIDRKAGVPAGILVWAHDATPFSTLYAALRDSQKSGFNRFRFALKSKYASLDGIPSTPSPPTPVVEEKTDIPDAIGTLPIHLHADDRGQINWAELGDQDVHTFDSLERQVTSLGSDAESPFEKARLDVDPTLVFAELVRVIELLGRVGVRAITFGLE